jgi:hypothetical protein
MTCNLCLKEKPLCNSHIISECFYEKIYDKDHRFIPLSLEDQKLKFQQKGFREELLCLDCEGRLSKWEKYLKESLVDIGNENSKKLKISRFHEKILLIENVNYDLFKRGVLSILWRLGLSKNNFFKSYRLGPYQNKLRNVLFNDSVIPKHHYPFTVAKYKLNNKYFPSVLMLFPPNKNETFTIHRFLIWGFMISIIVCDHQKLNKLDRIIFSEDKNYIAERQYTELAGPESVIKRIFDNDVNKMFSKLSP